MKKILILAALALAAWYGSKHFRELCDKRPSHGAAGHNSGRRTVERLRLSVGGQTFVRDRLDAGADTEFRFLVNRDSRFELVWQWSDSPVESHWEGGFVPAGPMVQRHSFSIDDDGGVVYTTLPLATAP